MCNLCYRQFRPPFNPGQGPAFGFPPGLGQGGTSNFGLPSGPPSGPPPAVVPQKAQAQTTVGIYAVDPGAIRPCRFRFIYIWPQYGRPFWAWLVFVGPRSAAGWRWIGYRWVYFGIDLNNIESFVCY